MSRRKAPPLSLVAALLGVLLATPAIAEIPATSAKTDTATSFELRGILISGAKRSILVNNELAREGDLVAGAEILEIGQRDVRIRVGSHEQSIRVGFSGEWTQPTRSITTKPSNPDSNYVSVRWGDTLSHIAERHLTGNVTRHQMMIAIFEANPQAFAGNINLLREGAVLQVPNDASLLQQAPETAVAEVVRQTKIWRANLEQRIQVAGTSKTNDLDSVAQPKTPTATSARVSRNDIARNEMRQIALKASSRSVGGNVEAQQNGTEISIAKVIRDVSAWWHKVGEPRQMANVIDHVNTTYDSFLEHGNPILLTKSLE